MKKSLLLVAIVLVFANCSKSNPTEPEPPKYGVPFPWLFLGKHFMVDLTIVDADGNLMGLISYSERLRNTSMAFEDSNPGLYRWNLSILTPPPPSASDYPKCFQLQFHKGFIKCDADNSLKWFTDSIDAEYLKLIIDTGLTVIYSDCYVGQTWQLNEDFICEVLSVGDTIEIKASNGDAAYDEYWWYSKEKGFVKIVKHSIIPLFYNPWGDGEPATGIYLFK